jgi:hypothetical protein
MYRKILRNGGRLFILLPLLVVGMKAQQPQINQPADATIQKLLQKIDELEAAQKKMQERLDALTGKPVQQPPAQAVSAVAAPEPAAAAVPVAQQPPADADMADPSTRDHALGPVTFRGFSDLDFGRAWFEKLPPGGLNGSPNSFNIGDFDLFTNVRISEHWSVVGEMLVTSDFTNEFGIEMDRLLLNYKPNQYFNIGFGKYNTALGYYPNEFHRARYFQTATARPVMYSDEDNGGILPVHNIGITATGAIPSGGLGLHWVTEVANGRSASHPEVPIQNFADENTSKAVDAGLYAKPDGLRGFQAGFSIYHDIMHPTEGPAVNENIFTGHVVYSNSKVEFLNEAALLRHAVENTSRVYRSLTGYTQVSYAFGKFRPFFRYDYQNIPEGDPLFGSQGKLRGPSFGLNRHISNYVVLKLQYGRLFQTSHLSANDFQIQLAFAF